MRLFDAALNIPRLQWDKQFQAMGVQNKDKDLALEGQQALKAALNNPELKQYIWLDLLLYDHAVEVHKSQVTEYGV